MKKTIVSIILILMIGLPVLADNVPGLKLKPVKNKSKISYNTTSGTWSDKPDCEHNLCFNKVNGFGEYSDYLYYTNGDFAFTTECEHEFLVNGKLIGYSNKDLNFYDISFVNGKVVKSALDKKEVQDLIPEYKVITLSQFSEMTNALKIKKGFGDLKLALINDTGADLNGYKFSSGNAKFEQYKMSGFIKISRSGMIQFADDSKNATSDTPWYVLLVR